MSSAGAQSVGRVPVVDVQPVLEQGRWPAKAVVGEAVPLTATVFRDGHDAEGATAVVTRPDGTSVHLPMESVKAAFPRLIGACNRDDHNGFMNAVQL